MGSIRESSNVATADGGRLSSQSHSQGYTVQREARRIFIDVLMQDKALGFGPELQDYSTYIDFDSAATKAPVLPGPMKMTETSTALWAMLCTVSNMICHQRYALKQRVTINADVATLFLISTALVRVNGKTLQDPELVQRYMKYDTGNSREPYRRLATNIYPTKDGRWFHLHGSMDATPTLTMLGLPLNQPNLGESAAIGVFCDAVKHWDSTEIDHLADSKYKQAGTICLEPEEFRLSEQGKAIANDGLYVLERTSSLSTAALGWPQNTSSGHKRPLEGIKMLDLSRVIAAPTIAKLAALFGATVIRISCATNPDMGPLLIDGNLGKRDVTLDLKSEAGKAALRDLIQDCDVFLDGYRPGAMEKLGFGPDAVCQIAEAAKGKGIVYVRENCYGWKGPMAHRSGWQQVSDCVTGVSWLQGRFLGLDEPVVPLIPNSDYQTGIIGLIGIMSALLQREKAPGSFLLSVALNYYNMFLLDQGELPASVQEDLKKGHKDLKLRHYDDMTRLVGKTVGSLMKVSPQFFRPEYFRNIPARLGVDNEVVTFLGPPAQFEQTSLQYDVGPSFLGYDKPQWP